MEMLRAEDMARRAAMTWLDKYDEVGEVAGVADRCTFCKIIICDDAQ